MNLSEQEILRGVRGKILVGIVRSMTGRRVLGVSTNTRTLKRGDLFIPLKGDRYDGHHFLQEAFQKGAAGALVMPASKTLLKKWSRLAEKQDRFLIQVSSTLKALGDLAHLWRKKFQIPVIAVTGSNGKTTTKEMIAQLLKEKYQVLKTEGNLNNLIGVPLTLFRLHQKHQAAVIEMGMNHPGEIRRLAEIAAPQIGLVTNIGPAHLAGLGTMKAVARAKGELFEQLPSSGMAVINADSFPSLLAPSLRRKGKKPRLITFGLQKEATYKGYDLKELGEKGTQFSWRHKKKFSTVRLPLLGTHAVSNALAAIAVGDLLSISPAAMKKQLKKFHPAKNRMEPVRVGSVLLLNDSYNANPNSMTAALKVLGFLKPKPSGRRSFDRRVASRRVALLGGMKELGAYSKKGHALVGEEVARQKIDFLITFGRDAKKIAQRACQKGFNRARIRSFDEWEELRQALPCLVHKNDTLLVKGSRSYRLERVLEEFRKKEFQRRLV
ncbi:MAG: UDP-N-acetylmuramoyl-tripeptide--D-alanyl-D-alanine ligase [bacterium]|nr:UDP-N-acetylmuramoyl-tripeptide--D-alanyl-D-alanine ligase [bacterium]